MHHSILIHMNEINFVANTIKQAGTQTGNQSRKTSNQSRKTSRNTKIQNNIQRYISYPVRRTYQYCLCILVRNIEIGGAQTKLEPTRD